ncbi:MAG: Hsp70 family protein, partial [Alphaproteobacteria bacterium]|nr:Hsp70 family protein [Alphaproteobacteria bacterium]
MKQAVCGIDFGTSNSTVALAGGTAAAGLVRLEGDKTTLPSAIFFRDGVGPVFGRAGINAYL